MHLNRLFYFFLLIVTMQTPIIAQTADSFKKEYDALKNRTELSDQELVKCAMYEHLTGNPMKGFPLLQEHVLSHPTDILNEYFLRIIARAGIVSNSEYVAFLEKCPASLELSKMFLMERYYSAGRLGDLSKLRKELHVITNMLAIAPFANDDGKGFDTIFPPETSFDLNHVYNGKIRPVLWRMVWSSPFGRIKPDNFFRPYKNVTGYFCVFLHSDKESEGTIKLGISTPFKIWINGQQIRSDEGIHSFELDQFSLPVKLNAGWNMVMLKSCPGNHELWSFLLRLSGFSNEVKESIQVPTEWHSMVLSHEETEKSEGDFVLEKLSEATNSATDKAQSYFDLGFYRYLCGNSDERKNIDAELFEKARAIKKSSLYSTYLGVTHSQERIRKNFLLEAISMNPQLAGTRTELLKYYYGLGYENTMNDMLQGLLKDFPKDQNILLSAVDYYFDKKYFNLADKYLKEITGEKDLSWYELSSLLAYASSSYTVYRETLEKAHELDKTDSKIRDRLVNSYREKNENLKALAILSEAFILYPDSIELLETMADIDLENNDIKTGLGRLKYAEKICPEDDILLSKIGRYCILTGEKTNARKYYQKALTIKPNDNKLKEYVNFLYPENNILFQYSKQIFDVVKPGENFPETTVLLNQQVSEIYKDGTYTTLFHLIVFLKADTDIERFKKQNVFYNPVQEKIDIIKARIYDADLKYTEVNDIGDYAYGGNDASLFYDLRVKQIVFPKLEKGSIIEYEYIKYHAGNNMYGRNYYGDNFSLQTYYPIRENRITLITEPEIVLNIQPVNMTNMPVLKKKNEKSGKKKVMTYSQTMIPKIKQEANMPSEGSFTPALYMSTFNTWREFGVWLTELYRDQLIPDDNMKKLTAEIVGNETETNAIISKIYQYIVGQIRYVGLEYGISGIQPRKIGTVVATGFGDCKDKASLMTALLRLSGIDADVALARTRSKGTYNYSLPLIEAFDHAVCFVHYRGGIIIDGTADYYTYGVLPASDNIGKVFVLDNAKSRFFRIQPAVSTNNRDCVKTIVNIQKNKGAYLKRNIYKFGQKGAEYRYQFFSVQDQQVYLNKYWNKFFPGSEVSDISYDGMNTLETEPSGEYRVVIPELLVEENGVLSFKTSLIRNDLITPYAASSKPRQNDLDLDYPFVSEDIAEYNLPIGWAFASIPQNVKIDSDIVSYSLTYVKKEKTLTIHQKMDFKRTIVPKEKYMIFRDILIRMNAAQEQKITVQGQ